MKGKVLAPLLIMFLLLACTWGACPGFGENYSNKDIEGMKKQQKNAPADAQTAPADSGKVYKNDDVKSLKHNDSNKSYRRKSEQKPSKPKENSHVQYQSPDGAIKIEVTSRNTISNKDIVQMKQHDLSKKYDRRKDSEKAAEDQKLPVSITEIPVREKLLPYKEWEEEYKDYFFKHYDNDSLELAPKIIVVRSTSSTSLEEVTDLFKRGSLYNDGDDGYTYGHLSCHFIVDKSGEIVQTLPLNVRSRGAYGVNHVAITIELIGMGNEELITNEYQKKSLYSLLSVLMKKFSIPLNKIYGHDEVAQGKTVVPEYTEFNDSDYPTCYPPDSVCYDPGVPYMQQLRSFFSRPTSKNKQ